MSYQINTLTSLKQHWLIKNSNIPVRFLGWEPSDIVVDKGVFPQEISDWINDALTGQVIKKIGGLGTTGVGLLFDGGPGLGKTTHAVTTIMEFIRNLPEDEDKAKRILGVNHSDYGRGLRPVYYLTFPEFLNKKKAIFDASLDERRDLYEEVEGLHGRSKYDSLNVRILVLDDLGKEYASSYNDASFDEILRSRYDKGLPTIVTTNVARENWAKQYKEAMGSFAYEAFHRIQLTGKDLR